MLKYKKKIRYLKKNVLCKYEFCWFLSIKNTPIQKKVVSRWKSLSFTSEIS